MTPVLTTSLNLSMKRGGGKVGLSQGELGKNYGNTGLRLTSNKESGFSLDMPPKAALKAICVY